MIPRLLFKVLVLLAPVLADYDCVCNYNVEDGVYSKASKTGQPIGYLYEFDCKPKYGDAEGNFFKIMYEHSVGFVEKNAQVQLQTCPGDIPKEELVTGVTTKSTTTQTTTTERTTTQTTTTERTTTQSTRPTTTPSTKPTTTSTTTTTTTPTTPTTTPTTTQTTTSTTTTRTTTTTTTPTTTPTTKTTVQFTTAPNQIIEGHIDACPKYVRETDTPRNRVFLGQYGEFCYQLVNSATQWPRAEAHCNFVSSGHLVHVLNQAEQDFLVKFLAKHHYVQSVWLGLTDSGKGADGKWRWTSGASVSYKNFQGDFASHSPSTHQNNDCIVLKQGGEWTDVPCGVALTSLFGFGEKHPYICQYNISSTLPSILEVIPHVVG